MGDHSAKDAVDVFKAPPTGCESLVEPISVLIQKSSLLKIFGIYEDPLTEEEIPQTDVCDRISGKDLNYIMVIY